MLNFFGNIVFMALERTMEDGAVFNWDIALSAGVTSLLD